MICDDEPVAWISGKVIHQFPDLAGGYEPLYRKAKMMESPVKFSIVGWEAGITAISLDCDKLVVGFDFSHFNKVSPETVQYNNELYTRGPLEIVRQIECGDFCSIRAYNRIH